MSEPQNKGMGIKLALLTFFSKPVVPKVLEDLELETLQGQESNCISDAETIVDFLGLGFLKSSQCVEMGPLSLCNFPLSFLVCRKLLTNAQVKELLSLGLLVLSLSGFISLASRMLREGGGRVCNLLCHSNAGTRCSSLLLCL